MNAFDYNSSVIYQIYPKSFFDSDNDGIGDLKGIHQKLPYLVKLGVDVIALSSIFESDYDGDVFAVTDYCKINPVIGSSEDFEELVSAVHEKNLKLFLTIPISYTSCGHEWFEQSKKQELGNLYREFYYWSPEQTKSNKSAPDSQKNYLGASLWSYEKTNGKWYKNAYGAKTPILNFENPRVRKEFLKVFSFWQEKGVDGFIINDVRFSMKKIVLSDLKPLYKVDESIFEFGGPLYHVLHECVSKEKDHPFVLSATATQRSVYPYLTDNDKPCCHSISAEYLITDNRLNALGDFSFKTFLKEYCDLQSALSGNQLSLMFEDVTHSRLISRITEGGDPLYPLVGKFLAGLLLTSSATPILYQGQEIGMCNYQLTKGSSSLRPGENPAVLHTKSPFQWDNNPQAAFTEATFPYLPVNDNYHKINVLSESQDPDSILNFYCRLIAFRKSSSALTLGTFEDHSDGNTLFFTRKSDTEELLVIANATPKPLNYRIPDPFSEKSASCEISNYALFSKPLHPTIGLRPYEIRIYRLRAPVLAIERP